MKHRNTGITDLLLPSGRRVSPGDTFNAAAVPDRLLHAWRSAGSVKPVVKKKPEDD
jgi:hypothetical protein